MKVPDNFKDMLRKTKDAFTEPWSIKDIRVSPDVMALIALLHSMLTLNLGLTLIIHGIAAPTGALISFMSLISVPVWGWLIVIALLVFLIGFFLRKSLPITIGALLNASVWVGVFICAAIGAVALGDGWRIAVPVFYIAFMWIIFFYLQLRRMRPNGE